MRQFNNPSLEAFRQPISRSLKTFKKRRKALLLMTQEFIGSPLTINQWYGRLGNNIQQIALGIMYARQHGYRFISPEHELIKSIAYNCPHFFDWMPKRKNRFFSFIGTEDVPDIPLDYEYIKEQMHVTIQSLIAPNLKIPKLEPLGDDCLVIHLRGGDIFNPDKTHCDYVQNPLSFYTQLIPKFKEILVVAEPGEKNPILNALKERYPIRIQSKSVSDDFATLMQATHLASSGVGTFALAAAMCSTSLRHFYCSDRYLSEHLNPDMLKQTTKVHITPLTDYIKIGTWDLSNQMLKQLLHYAIKPPHQSVVAD